MLGDKSQCVGMVSGVTGFPSDAFTDYMKPPGLECRVHCMFAILLNRPWSNLLACGIFAGSVAWDCLRG